MGEASFSGDSAMRHGLAGNLPERVLAIIRMAEVPTDISEHLLAIYSEALECRPKLIVELGVRGGESTKALLLAAELSGARVVSVDIEDCSRVSSVTYWTFVQAEDVFFGGAFSEWAHSRGLDPAIDVLFIDTSHAYEHTVAEIRTWFPYLAPGAKVLFHDTSNNALYGLGVTRAIEDFLQIQFEESGLIPALCVGDWLIRHNPACNGLTVLKKLDL